MFQRLALLSMCGVQALAGQAGADVSKSSFAGIVIDSATGQPLRKADIQLFSTHGSHSTVSGLDGHFAASELAPGEYQVHVERQGYLDCDCLAGVKISTGQQITGVQIKLTQYGSISGRVVDPDGDAWPNGSVEIYRLAWRHGKRMYQDQDQGDVDDRGLFRIGKLPPGRYFVAAVPSKKYQTTFYPGTIEPSAAVSIPLATGQDLNGIEIKLQAAEVYHIRGRIVGVDMEGFDNRTPGNRIIMGMHRNSEIFEDSFGAPLNLQPDGRFELSGVPSGSYTINVQSMLRAFSAGMTTARLGEAAVQMNGHDVDDVMINAIPPRPLKVTVLIDGVDHPDLSGMSILLSSDDGGFSVATYKDDFIFPAVSLGSYQIHLQGSSTVKYYVKSVRAGGMESKGPMLDLRRTGDAPVTILLSDRGAAVHATVQTDSPDPEHTTVILIPDVESTEQREQNAVVAAPDHEGIFAIANIPPGEYRLFAWHDLQQDAWNDVDFWNAIREKGIRVKLAESDDKPLKVPLIPWNEMTAVLSRLGIQ